MSIGPTGIRFSRKPGTFGEFVLLVYCVGRASFSSLISVLTLYPRQPRRLAIRKGTCDWHPGSLAICTVLYIAVVLVLTGSCLFDSSMSGSIGVGDRFHRGSLVAFAHRQDRCIAGNTAVILVMMLAKHAFSTRWRTMACCQALRQIHPGFVPLISAQR